MKKLLIFASVVVLCLVMAACGPIGDPDDTTAATTTTTTTVTTTAAPEEVLEEISEPEKFDNVTMKMVGTVDGDDFDYDIYFANGNCLMIDNDGGDPQLYEGDDATMVRSVFVDTALALLAEGDRFALTNEGYRCNDAITYECDVLGAGRATIVATNNLVTLNEGESLHSLSCNMLQSCEGDTVDVVVTFTFTAYGTTVINAPAE